MPDPVHDQNAARMQAQRAVPFAPAARRTLCVFGTDVELALLPHRASRPDRPGARPAFGNDRGMAIVEAEASWRDNGLALTGNKFPFARAQTVLWSERPLREPDEAFLEAALSWTDAIGGSLLVNSIGAAASIPRAHAHHTDETMPFLGQLNEEPLEADWLPRIDGVTFAKKTAPFWLLCVRGAAPARAKAIAALQMRRLTAAINLVAMRGETFVYPRSSETPAPHFPYPLGAAEIWGRWCYVEERAFAAATSADLEQALIASGCAI
jgi:hypothetical protein